MAAPIKVVNPDTMDPAFKRLLTLIVGAMGAECESVVKSGAEALKSASADPRFDYVPNTMFLVGSRLLVRAAYQVACSEAGEILDRDHPLVVKYVKVFAATIMKYPDLEGAGREFFTDAINTEGSIQ